MHLANLKGWIDSTFRTTKEDMNQTLADCFECANDEIYVRSQGTIRNRAYVYFTANDRLTRISNVIERTLGIKAYSYVGAGDNAIVVRYGELQALRFRAPALEGEARTGKVLEAPFICPVWKEVFFDKGRLNFVPFIPSLDLAVRKQRTSRQAAEGIVYSLIKAGFEHDPELWFYDYRNYDFKFEQIGLLNCATPIIIDQGAVIRRADAPTESSHRMEKDRELAMNHVQIENSNWDGAWSDHYGLDRIESIAKPSNDVLMLPDKLNKFEL